MNSGYSINSNSQHWQALACRALFWVEENALLLSDLHLGRVAHLRKNGFALSPNAALEDIALLTDHVCSRAYTSIYVLGDLFHSRTLGPTGRFSKLIERSDAKWVLVRGNHDIFDIETYLKLGFSSIVDQLILGNKFLLKHEPSSEDLENYFCISGHVHPGYLLTGKAKQSVVLPCFYFSSNQIVLPAFGQLTGLHKITRRSKSDSIVVCTSSKVIGV